MSLDLFENECVIYDNPYVMSNLANLCLKVIISIGIQFKVQNRFIYFLYLDMNLKKL